MVNREGYYFSNLIVRKIKVLWTFQKSKLIRERLVLKIIYFQIHGMFFLPYQILKGKIIILEISHFQQTQI